MRKFWIWVLLSCFMLVQIVPVQAAGVAWEAPLDNALKWSKVTGFGTLLIGSDASLASYNPESGAKMWEREDLKKLAPFDVQEVDGYPILILGKDKGLGGTKSEIEAVNMGTGAALWKTDRINGAPLGVYTVPGRPQVLLFVNVNYDEDRQQGIFILSYSAETGELQWETKYDEKANSIPLHMADNAGMFYARMDFSGYQAPVFEGNRAYVSFKGASALDLDTGKILWEVPFKPAHKSYKKAYAAPVVSGDVVYATGGGVVYALDKNSGEVKWKTAKVSSGLIAQLVPLDDMVLARIGGNFYDPGQKKYVLDKPLAVFSYNKTDGTSLWEFRGVKGGITNMVYLPEGNSVFLADGTSLIGIDAKSSGKVKETFRLPLEFKRKVGAADVTSAGVKAVTGGITGLIGAGAKLAVGKERQDPPVWVSRISDDKLVVRGEQHILSFNPKTQAVNWSLSYSAPGQSAFGIALMAGVTVFSVAVSNVQYASGQTSMSSASSSIQNAFGNMDKYIDRRYTKSQGAQEQAYILTNIDDGKEKGIGIMAIRLSDGETAGQYLLNDKLPEYTIDTVDGRLYYFQGKKKIVAYDL